MMAAAPPLLFGRRIAGPREAPLSRSGQGLPVVRSDSKCLASRAWRILLEGLARQVELRIQVLEGGA